MNSEKYIGYLELDILQSIFSSAARLQMGVVGKKSWKPRR